MDALFIYGISINIGIPNESIMPFFATRKPLTVIDDNFRNKSFSTVQDFLDANFAKQTFLFNSPSPVMEPYTEPFEGISESTAFWILNDRGRGRVSEGLQRLYVLNTIIAGKGVNAMSYYNDVGNTYYSFASASDEDQQIIVLNILGMFDIYNLSKTVTPLNYNAYTKTIEAITFDVRNARFTVDKYKKQLLIDSRKLANMVIGVNK